MTVGELARALGVPREFAYRHATSPFVEVRTRRAAALPTKRAIRAVVTGSAHCDLPKQIVQTNTGESLATPEALQTRAKFANGLVTLRDLLPTDIRGVGMRISRIQIHNFRNFKDLDISLGNHVVIVGEN